MTGSPSRATDVDLVSLALHDGLAVVELSSPPANALSAELIAALGTALARIRDSDTYALVLCSSVPGFFGAGADLRHLHAVGPEDFRSYLRPLRELLAVLRSLPIPTVAAIDGMALGGGFELALNCDLRFIGPDGSVGLPEIRLGLLPGATGTQRLTALVGAARATELMLTGRRIGADEAAQHGIAVRAEVSARESAVSWARRSAGGGNQAAAAILRCIAAAGDPSVDGLAVEFDEVAGLFASEYAQGRIADFVSSRS